MLVRPVRAGRASELMPRARAKDRRGRTASRDALRQAEQPVAKVVDVAGGAPPARDDELATALGRHVAQALGEWVVGLVTEHVLFEVGHAENVVANHAQRGNGSRGADRQVVGEEHEVARLQRVRERHPEEITDGKHVAKAFGRDVGGRQHGLLPMGEQTT